MLYRPNRAYERCHFQVKSHSYVVPTSEYVVDSGAGIHLFTNRSLVQRHRVQTLTSDRWLVQRENSQHRITYIKLYIYVVTLPICQIE